MRTLIVGVLLFLIVVAVAMYATGVIRINDTPGQTNITVDKEELKQQTQQAVEKAKENSSELLRKAGRGLERTGENLQREANEQDKDVDHTSPTPSGSSATPN